MVKILEVTKVGNNFINEPINTIRECTQIRLMNTNNYCSLCISF